MTNRVETDSEYQRHADKALQTIAELLVERGRMYPRLLLQEFNKLTVIDFMKRRPSF